VTPEGKVKQKVREVLKAHPDVWYFMPVLNGMGQPTLDFLCAVRVKDTAAMFAIETKSPGNKPTERQKVTIEKMEAVGVKVFVIDGDTVELETWLHQLEHYRNGNRC
jgi:hypothetical protein